MWVCAMELVELFDFPETIEQYTEVGFRTFPVVKGEKVPAVKDWQGFHSDDFDLKRFNVGVQTGMASGVVVLDIDPKHDGWESLNELEKEHGKLPETLRSTTANGGAHFYFVHPGTHPIRNGTHIYGKPGVDVRGDGGFVVAPPSVLTDGKAYVWDIGSSLALAPLPQWLQDHSRGSVKPAIEESEYFPEGTRNSSLARLAGSMRRYGLTEQDILDTLLNVNQSKCNPPLPEAEVRNIARSIANYTPEQQPERAILSLSAPAFVALDLKPPKYLIQGVWPEECIGFIGGPPKTFKSFVAMEMAYAIATGKPFVEHFTVPEQRTALIIQQESSKAAYRVRMQNAAVKYGDAPNLYVLSNYHMTLGEDATVERLETEIDRLRPAFVVLDPLASFIKGDENSAQAMGNDLIRLLRRLRDTYHTGFCIVHHSSKPNGGVSIDRGGMRLRGSSSLYAAAEAGMWVDRVDKELPRSRVVLEQKEAESPPPFQVELDTERGVLMFGTDYATEREEPEQAYIPYQYPGEQRDEWH